MMGANLEDIASGIDELMIRQPVGVVGVITPFNFPGMIPLWFLPYAVACGNTLVLKPSEKTPMTMAQMFELIETAGFPPGVVNLVHGGKTAVDALLDHPDVRAISFVGSSPVARYVYGRAAANGKRAQCQGGAKNPIVDPARRRDGDDDTHCRRLGVRVRRAALSCLFGSHHGGRSVRDLHAGRSPMRPQPQNSAMASSRHGNGAGDFGRRAAQRIEGSDRERGRGGCKAARRRPRCPRFGL